MRKRIRLTENELNSLVNKSVKRILSETHWRTSLDAYNKSSELVDGVYHIIDNLREVESFLRDYAESVKGAKPMYVKFAGYIDEIFNYLMRKHDQMSNFEELSDENFKNQHDGKTLSQYTDDFENETMRDDFEGFNDNNDPSGKKREFQDYYDGPSTYQRRTGEYIPNPDYYEKSRRAR